MNFAVESRKQTVFVMHGKTDCILYLADDSINVYN